MNPVGYIEEHYDIYIDAEKGVVAAKLTERNLCELLYEEFSFLEKKIGFAIDYDFFSACANKILKQKEVSLMAKAKCNFDEGEVWDEELGVALAVRRLTNQVLILFEKFWEDFEYGIYNAYSRAVNHRVAYHRRREDNRRAATELSGEMWGVITKN